ncbi:zinc finger protein 43-like [Ostrinia nubilalis]|uniref:zinc finger protein 43-like n=1 Tax=Ostrinia nubilalis TaxID=29057 RepID=UPI00308232E5
MNQNMVEMDPLSSYEYPGYDTYNPAPIITPNLIPPNIIPPNIIPPNIIPPYNYDVKMEPPPMTNHEFFNNFLQNVTESNVNQEKVHTNLNEEPNRNNFSNNVAQNNTDNDVKPDIKKTIKKEKLKGKRSSYWSEKITDDNFQFYGCAICNISYPSLGELDQHVTIHKDRLTSYDLKIKNLMKRKKLKKEQKKLKKLKGKVKKEDKDFEIPEIKPEEGYIGNEKATEYNGENSNQNNENQPSNSTDDKKDVKLTTNENSNATDKNLEKIYKCFACQKQFTLSYYLKLHVRSHTDEKPYTCSVCGQSFITASKLGRHNKRIHLSVRYQCRICYRFFNRFENLTVHFDKKHPDDKLEGEPYDFNAILPYLKELEEQLREKAEAEAEAKPKSEDMWGDVFEHNQTTDSGPSVLPKDEDTKHFDPPPPIDVLIEEVKVDPPDVDIKRECDDDAPADDGSVKDERWVVNLE